MEDLDLLVSLCETIKETSLCGLGQTAPNPVLSTLKYFKNEYLEHIEHKRRPAGVCNMEKPAPVAATKEVFGMSDSMGVKTLTIDGQEVSARSGQTILEVARENDINIPTLCHLEGLGSVGCLPPMPGRDQEQQ